VLTGAGLLLMAQIHPGDSYVAAVLPSLAVLGAGFAALMTPITATVLASVDARHSGIASAVSNALSRLGQMIAVAALPSPPGFPAPTSRTPPSWQPTSRSQWPSLPVRRCGRHDRVDTIRDDALNRPAPDIQPKATALSPSVQRHCAVAGTPLATSPDRRPSSHPPAQGI
jgi:hypothetical protein